MALKIDHSPWPVTTKAAPEEEDEEPDEDEVRPAIPYYFFKVIVRILSIFLLVIMFIQLIFIVNQLQCK